MTDGTCGAEFVFRVCQVTLGIPTPSGSVTRRVPPWSPAWTRGTSPSASWPIRPEWVTTDLALDAMPNRIVTFAAVAAVLLAGILLPAVALVRNRRAGALGA